MNVAYLPARLLLLTAAGLLGACTQGFEKSFERTKLPDQVVPLYNEVAAFKSRSPGTADTASVHKRMKLDLGFLIGDSKVARAVIAPFDEERWYEPVAVDLRGTTAIVDLDVTKDFLVALDLGEVARNNYQAITQLDVASGLIPGGLKPRLCQLILCPAERFPLQDIGKRLPDVDGLPFEIGNVLPPIPVGPINRSGSICDRCFDRGPNILPCIVWKWCGEFPIPRKVHVRRNIYTLSPAQITTLRNGVAAMKARPATDPTSWWYQAKMHSVDAGVAQALQNQCQHRQFLFFSWHRMFVYYFERIMRKASGDPNFAQPYWNYTDLAAQGPIPEAYRVPAAASNALYDATRLAIYNGGAGLPPGDVSYASGFNLTNFTTTTQGAPSFGGRTVAGPMHLPVPAPGSGELEFSPHNNVHNDISGDMASGESPRDPVFWLHHSNLDRLWKRWLALGNGRANPTGDNVWMTHVFTFFDENGTQVNLTGAQVLNTVSQLGYRYDDDPYVLWPLVKVKLAMAPQRSFQEPEVLAGVRELVRLGTARVDTRIALTDRSRAALAASVADTSGERLVLQLGNIHYDAPVGLSYLLFLNLPADAKEPDHTHPSFIGTLGFFGGSEHGDHPDKTAAGLTQEYDVTRVMRRLGAKGDLVVTAVPSLPVVPPDRKDLQALRARLRPNGDPRFGEITLLRLKVR